MHLEVSSDLQLKLFRPYLVSIQKANAKGVG